MFEDPSSDDARCLVPEEKVVDLASLFVRGGGPLIDDIKHELLGELAGNELDLGAIISPDQLAMVVARPIGWAVMAGSPILRPPPPGRSWVDDNFSERLLRGYQLDVPNDVWEAMLAHPSIRRFTAEEVARTEEGLVVATADDRVTRIGNNMLLPAAFKAA